MQGGSKGAGAVLLLAVLAGAAGGFVAGMLVADGAAVDTRTPSAVDGEPALLRELQVLNREVAGLRADLGRRALAGAVDTGSEPPVPSPLAASSDAGVLLEQLAAAIADAARGAESPQHAPQVDPIRRQTLHDAVVEFARGSRPWSTHTLWTERKLLDAYGLPSSISVNADDGTERWVYEFEDANWVWFTVHDGRVVREWVQK